LTPEYLQAYKRKYRIQMMIRASVAACLMGAVVVSAQGPVTNRLTPTTLRGTIVEVSCFRQQGAATVSTPEQIGCAKKRVAEGGRLGILTEGDGLFQIAGAFSTNKFAKLAPLIGQRVEMSGAEVVISNNYDYRSFDAEKVTKAK
jgi:hypothetical protein